MPAAEPRTTRPREPAPPLVVAMRPHDLVLELHGAQSLRVDAEGRFCSYRRGPTFFRRTLDGEIVVRRGEAALACRAEEVAQVVSEVAEVIRAAREALAQQRLGIVLLGEVTAAEVEGRLARAEVWDIEAYRGERGRFRHAYPEPVRILPPDRYRDVVVLPSLGCPYGACTFCAFYRGSRYATLGQKELRDHIERVMHLFGRSLPSRNGVFLGSGSALSLPQAALEGALELVSGALGPRARGVAAFHDPDHAPPRSAADFRELRDRGLRHVTSGLESGCPPVREGLGKDPSLERFARAVTAEKEAGIRIGITVLSGAGGSALADAHVRETARFLSALPLDAGDLVYVSPLVEATDRGNQDPTWRKERRRLHDAIAAATPARVVPYRMDLFRYYA